MASRCAGLLLLGLLVVSMARGGDTDAARDALRAAECWCRALDDADPMFRCEAAAELGRLGAAFTTAIPCLVRALGDPTDLVRRSAATTAGEVGPAAEPCVELLIGLLERGPDRTAEAAATALGKIGARSDVVVPALVRASTLERLQYPCIQSLGKFGPRAASAVPRLVEALNSKRFGLPREAADCLGQIGPAAKESMPALSKLLASSDWPLKLAAAEALLRIGAPRPLVVPTLLAAIGDSDGNLEKRAYNTLVQHGNEGAALDELKAASKAPDAALRRTAARGLGRLAARSDQAVDALVAMLKEPDWWVRLEAIEWLTRIGPRAAPAAPMLAALAAQKGQDQEDAAIALFCTGVEIGRSVGPVLEQLKHPRHDRRQQALRAFGSLEARARLWEAAVSARLDDPVPEARAEAFEALVRINPNSSRILPTLVKELDGYASSLYVEAISRFGKEVPGLLPALAKSLKGRISSAPAATILARLDVPAASVRDALRGLTYDEAMHVAGCFQKQGACESAAAVVEGFRRDKDARVRAGVAGMLGSLGPKAVGATGILIELAGDANEDVRWQAVEALRTFAPTPEIVDAVRSSLTASGWFLRQHTALVLGKMGSLAVRAKAHLEKAAQSDENYAVRREATRALHRMSYW
ncbi:MAG: HEAT repeat domain-containing protein [Candidatus Riflebacteria bacterium]|nr:HEAT repeat domain-containing protein [Candidatus Riflebacteria bacterium]